MPFRDPDPTDPNMLVGVMLPADAEANRDMAYVFAEEFARLGYDRGQLLGLFKTPFYGGAHGAYQQLGETEILSIIDECLNAWGQAKFSILDAGSFELAQDMFSIEERDAEISDPESKTCAQRVEGSAIQNPKSKIRNGGREE